MKLRERACAFGPDDALVGVVTEPVESDRAVDRPAVILLNAGLVHKVGPFRLTVQIARTLAERGYTVLRFDLSGFGDSRAVGPKRAVEEQVVIDGRAAMDFLEGRYGITRFVVGGLCSGAVYAHYVTAADPRVVGMWMLDGYAYPTRSYRRYRLKRSLLKVASPRAALKWLLHNGLASRRTTAPKDAKADESIFYQKWPDIDDARSDMQAIVARGTRVLFVYTGGWSTFVAARQFAEMFPTLAAHPGVDLQYYPHADHTYISLSDRAVLIGDLTSFVDTMAVPTCAEPSEASPAAALRTAAVRSFRRS